MKHPVLLVCVTALVSACGGTSIETGRIGDGPVSASQINDFLGVFPTLETVDQVGPADLPPSGTTTYNGLVALEEVGAGEDVSPGLFGRLEIDVTFAGAGVVEGRAGDFVYASDGTDDSVAAGNVTPVGGLLTLRNGELQRTDPAAAVITAQFAGTLDLPAVATGTGIAETAAFNTGGILGGFLADGRVAGISGGTLEGTAAGSTFSKDYLGAFLAED